MADLPVEQDLKEYIRLRNGREGFKLDLSKITRRGCLAVKRRQQVVCVVGMHRSGTSAVTRCLRALHVELGNEFLPAQPDNPKGFWENPTVVSINEQLFAHLGLAWHSLSVPEPGWWAAVGIDDLRKEAISFIENTFSSAHVWGFKDPRTSRLLPFWQTVFQTRNFNDTYILVVRNPLSVAQSLTARDGFSTEHSMLLWMEYTLESLFYTRGKPLVVVDYDTFLAQPKRELQRIAKKLLLPLPGEESVRWVEEEFLDQALRHVLIDPAEIVQGPGLFRAVGKLYELCLSLVHDEHPVSCDAEIERMVESLQYLSLLLRCADVERERNSEAEKRFLSASAEANQWKVEVHSLRDKLEDETALRVQFSKQLALNNETLLGTIRSELMAQFALNKALLGEIQKAVATDTRLAATLSETQVALNAETRLRSDADQQAALLKEQLLKSREDVLRLRSRLADAMRTRTQLEKRLDAHYREVRDLQREIQSARSDGALLHTELEQMQKSLSWRLLAPVRALRALQRDLTRGWRRYAYSLLPGPQVRATDDSARWRSLGDDPWFILNGHTVGGWIDLWYDMRTDGLDRAFLYVDDGSGFSEHRRIRLPATSSGRVRTLLVLPARASGLRIDPLERPGSFLLSQVSIRPLAKWQVGWRFLVPVLRAAVGRPSVISAGWRTFRKGGMKAVKARLLRGHAPSADQDYAAWIQMFDALSDDDREAIRRHIDQLGHRPLISILMPTYNSDERFLRAAIESVLRQLYPNWELCIADDASTAPHVRRILEDYRARDGRIKVVYREENGHIAAASNSALELVGGEFVALLDHDDELAEHALYMVAAELDRYTDAVLIYSDEDKIDENGNRRDPYFKSDWNPDLFYGQNMISHLGVYRTANVRKIGGFRSAFNGSQDYDLAVRIVETTKPERIHHIPHVLYHWRAISGSVALSDEEKPYAVKAARGALQEHFDRCSISARSVPGKVSSFHRARFALPSALPTVSVIIPTKNRGQLLQNAITSVADATYRNTEIIVIDNLSDDPETTAYLDELRSSGITVLEYAKPFNYSAINNMAAHHARGEVLLFLNNDVEAMDAEWLSEMVSHAVRPEVGAVGAALYYPDRTLQHGGVVLGLGTGAGHMHSHLSWDDPGYFGRAALVQDLSAVTGACLATRRSVFLEVGGFNEGDLPIAFNDVDWCLRVRERGYLIVWTPYARLYHHESATRGYEDDSPERRARFERECASLRKRWGDILDHDPYYNPNLSLEHADFRLAWPPRVNKPWKRNSVSTAMKQERIDCDYGASSTDG